MLATLVDLAVDERMRIQAFVSRLAARSAFGQVRKTLRQVGDSAGPVLDFVEEGLADDFELAGLEFRCFKLEPRIVVMLANIAKRVLAARPDSDVAHKLIELRKPGPAKAPVDALYVGSRRGKTYYSIIDASKVVAKNRIYFKIQAEAVKAGRKRSQAEK
jgi:hypothetical protein